MTQRFLELTQFWYEYVGSDHHKDRDCHFYINQVYSYGEPPYWRIEHYGYITELPDELSEVRFDSYELAAAALENWLLAEVRDVIKFYINYDPADKNIDYNWPSVKKLSEEYKHLLE